MKKEGLRFSASNPDLSGRIYSKIDPSKDTVYWYIKFNIPLDPKSVSGKSMFVTDIGGYVMETFIEYSVENNLISISPIDSYAQNTFYILTITNKVRSSKGNKLPREIHIVFKLIQDQISNYEIMKKDVELPKPTPRPKNYDINNVTSKIYGFDKDLNTPYDVTIDIKDQVLSDDNSNKKHKNNTLKTKQQLPFMQLSINFVPIILSIFLILGSILVGNINIILGTLVLGALCILYTLSKFLKKETRAALYYNFGVMQFNKDKFEKAKVNFGKALLLDEYSEQIEYANNKIKHYIK